MVTTNQKSMMDTHKKGERNPNIALKTIVIILNGKSVKQEDRNKKELEKQKTVNKMTVGTPSISSVAQSCPTLCDPMDCSTPGFPVHHQLPELAQTHARQVGGAIEPSHPLSPTSPPALSLSQHQGLFQWVSSLHQVAEALEWDRVGVKLERYLRSLC